MQKLNIGLVAAVVIFVGLNIFQFIFWRNTNNEVAQQYTSEIATLEKTIAGYGDSVTVYTVNTAVKSGDEITDENIETMQMYSSLLTDQFVTNPDDIKGRFFKIAVNPGTPIMSNMVMDEELEDSARDRDVALDHVTVGLHVGDYIDVRMTMPYGDDYVVLSHKRVYDMGEETIKLHLTEYEWNVYQGALIDYFLNKEFGCTIYADKYIEPGIQNEAIPFYAVPTNIAALLQKNPNIVDKQGAASLNEWRSSLEELLVIFRNSEDTVESDGALLSTGRAGITEGIEADRATKRDEEQKAEEEAAAAEEAAAGDSTVSDDFWDEDVDTTTPSTETTAETTDENFNTTDQNSGGSPTDGQLPETPGA